MGLGNRVYGLAGIALGAIGLVRGDFNAPWHAVPPEFLAPTSAAHAPLAYAAALLFVIGGLAMQVRRTAAGGALVLAALFAVFALLWGYRATQYPGIFGIWLGVAEESALVIGGAVAAINLLHGETHPRRAQVGRLAFGLCLLVFGAAHLIYVNETAAMVPAWLPRQDLWAQATGIADILAGLAFLSGISALLAARLVTLMFAAFGVLVWAPKLAGPPDHLAWAGTAITFALAGAAWVLAESIAAARE